MGREQEEQSRGERNEEETNKNRRGAGTGATRDTSLPGSDKGRCAAQQGSVSQAMLPALTVSQRSWEHMRAIQGRRTAVLDTSPHDV
jgi:hypothetical protein